MMLGPLPFWLGEWGEWCCHPQLNNWAIVFFNFSCLSICFCCICEIGVWCSPLLRDVPFGDTVQRCLKQRIVWGRICLDDLDFTMSWSGLTKLTVVRNYTFTLQKRFNVNKSIYEMRYVQDYIHLFVSMPLCKYIFRFMSLLQCSDKQFVSSTSIFGLLMDHISMIYMIWKPSQPFYLVGFRLTETQRLLLKISFQVFPPRLL